MNMTSYHVSSSGKLVPCASDPCSRHSNDIHADSLESAYEQYYADSPVGFVQNTPKTAKNSQNHRFMSFQKFNKAKKAALATLAVILTTTSLSACGTELSSYHRSNSYNNTFTQSSSNAYDNTNLKNALKSVENKAKDAWNSNTAKEYRSRANKVLRRTGSRFGRILRDLKSRIPQNAQNSTNFGGSTVNNGSADASALRALGGENVTMQDLNNIQVVSDHPNTAHYRRKDYSNGRWASIAGKPSCWSVRDEVITRQAIPGSLKLTPDGCAVESVSIVDPYTGDTIKADNKSEVVKNIQIDHVIPIAYADSNGAHGWNQSQKDSYYNDLTEGHLVATSAHQNRDLKGDKGPGEYMLDNNAPLKLKVAYAKDWVAIMRRYNKKGARMTLEKSDYDAIMRIFKEGGVR